MHRFTKKYSSPLFSRLKLIQSFFFFFFFLLHDSSVFLLIFLELDVELSVIESSCYSLSLLRFLYLKKDCDINYVYLTCTSS